MKKVMLILCALVLTVSISMAQGWNNATYVQHGVSNVVGIAQAGGVNNAFINQLGEMNKGYITQTGYAWCMPNNANINQIGYNQMGTIVQNGTMNNATINQGRSLCGVHCICFLCNKNNVATINQMYRGNNAMINQYGQGGMVMITQTAGMPGKPSHNNATVTQMGHYEWIPCVGWIHGCEGNMATITQTGFYNNAMVCQMGSFNNSVITQMGSFNNVNGTQIGDHNMATVTQTNAYPGPCHPCHGHGHHGRK